MEKIFVSSTTWLEANDALLLTTEKGILQERRDGYFNEKNAIANRTTEFTQRNNLSEGMILSYRDIMDLQDQYNDLVKDIEKMEGEIETDLKGLISRYPKSSGLPELKRQHPKLFSSKRKS